ncbi:MAG: hypothetical protein FWE28_05480 [Oscillospiraceae bacterium]|nr:hypothetical protein [Oscillospiraceae bacterium]
MIISNNREPSLGEFQALVDTATLRLNDDAKHKTPYYITRGAQKLEDDVYDFLNNSAVGTKFEGTIKKVSGQRFPDIVAAKYYGVEVKSSKDEKWTSLGGSVNESTRVDGVERIFLTFGKLVSPVEFRSRPYEDCLSEIVATHYPRYKIDMKLGESETIFDKMNTSYDDLRNAENPIGEVVKYYKSQLKDGESLWWIDTTDSEVNATASMKVRLWSSLQNEERLQLKASLFALFPDILSTISSKKYSRAVLWLASHHGIVDSSFRDNFSAGGKVTLFAKNEMFERLPQVFGHIQELMVDIRLLINSMPTEVLAESWKVNKIDSDRISQWINLVAEKHQSKDYDSAQILKSIFEP